MDHRDSMTGPPSQVEARITAAELSRAAGLSPAALDHLVRLGLVEPAAPGEFEASTALRLTRMLRLRRDLGIGLTSAAIIVRLLERIDDLDARLHGGRG
jgi:DNA-binding transcriptional MerR regulator